MKKFKEFNENNYVDQFQKDVSEEIFKKYKDIKSIISEDDLDDQFLKLKEVMHCHVARGYNQTNNFRHYMARFYDRITLDSSIKDFNKLSDLCNKLESLDDVIYINIDKYGLNNKEEVIEEINRIKRRMENMYPVVFDVTNLDNRDRFIKYHIQISAK
jgi:hypothetical protein